MEADVILKSNLMRLSAFHNVYLQAHYDSSVPRSMSLSLRTWMNAKAKSYLNRNQTMTNDMLWNRISTFRLDCTHVANALQSFNSY